MTDRTIDVTPVAVNDSPLGLYMDNGRSIVTNSMLKSFRRCPKQAEYKYVHRLKPRLLGKPLSRGKWLHSLLEEYHMGRDWEGMHRKLTAQFNDMFDEERDFYGDMPTECHQIMLGYIWHYKADPWKVLEVEFTLESELPDGTILRGRIDAMVETEHGIYFVDHKSHKTFPDFNFRLFDSQSALYLWMGLRNRIPVEGFIWNYLRTKAPSKPKLAYAGTARQRLSHSAIDTDYLTFVTEIKRLQREEGLKVTSEIKAQAEMLKKQRYQHGEPQTSAFFRRDVLEKNNDMLRRVALENYHTARRLSSYPFEDRDAVERTVDRSCTYMCSYTDICAVELLGGNTRPLIKQNYRIGDPMDYYYDDKTPDKGGE